jgi:glycogen operon protein
MLSPDGKYYNFSGCGNTMNCNHPIVQQMIIECLRYWVINYRVDGFRFDLASILGRNEDGTPMSKPPLLQSLAFDPILGNIKLIAEAWDAGGLYQVGSFPSWNRWAEWNGRYRDDLRSFLKGDGGFSKIAAERIAGSSDMYDPGVRGYNASVNFLNCHDGFTLYDMYSYNGKHNEMNGWNSTDGHNDNRSWNCGAEGETDDPAINGLRQKLMRNACAVLMVSRGTPMFLMGDEFCNTQFGNNNPYCQDNEISWLDWGYLEKNKSFYEFFRYMIAFRKKHTILRKRLSSCFGFPDVSFHGSRAWQLDEGFDSRTLGVMFAGYSEETGDDVVFLAVNAHWENRKVELPNLPQGWGWRLMASTGDISRCYNADGSPLANVSGELWLEPRSIAVLAAGKETP